MQTQVQSSNLFTHCQTGWIACCTEKYLTLFACYISFLSPKPGHPTWHQTMYFFFFHSDCQWVPAHKFQATCLCFKGPREWAELNQSRKDSKQKGFQAKAERIPNQGRKDSKPSPLRIPWKRQGHLWCAIGIIGDAPTFLFFTVHFSAYIWSPQLLYPPPESSCYSFEEENPFSCN